MKTPTELQPLIDDGVIDEVLRSLKSGKEATVYLVRSRTETRCAKVYRNMAQRSFQKRAQYQEGRKVRGSRQARAMSKSTSFGRAERRGKGRPGSRPLAPTRRAGPRRRPAYPLGTAPPTGVRSTHPLHPALTMRWPCTG